MTTRALTEGSSRKGGQNRTTQISERPLPADSMRRLPVHEEVAADLAQRAAVGLRTYGVLLGEADLSSEELVQHAYEEACDMACYLKALLRQLRRDRDRNTPRVFATSPQT